MNCKYFVLTLIASVNFLSITSSLQPVKATMAKSNSTTFTEIGEFQIAANTGGNRDKEKQPSCDAMKCP